MKYHTRTGNGGFFENLEQMEKASIKFIQENEPECGYFVAFSGGKDSIVVENLVKRSGVKYKAYYNATGIDPPEVVQFIKKEYPYVIFKHPKIGFFKAIKKKKILPTIGRRWCCDILKKFPIDIPEYKFRILGMRAEESSKRAKYSEKQSFKGSKVYLPIFRWKEWHVWDYIKKYNLKYPSLYDEGFDRLGCVICPFICGNNQTKINIGKERWPGIYKAFEHAAYYVYEKKWHHIERKKGKSMLFEEFIDNWYHGVSATHQKFRKNNIVRRNGFLKFTDFLYNKENKKS